MRQSNVHVMCLAPNPFILLPFSLHLDNTLLFYHFLEYKTTVVANPQPQIHMTSVIYLWYNDYMQLDSEHNNSE